MKNLNQSKNNRVNEVFNKVFNKYDLMNDLMSLGVHRIWKKKLVDWINPTKESKVLDMSSGTGDVAKEFLERVNIDVLKPGGRFICLEFSKVENEILEKIYKTYSKLIPLLGKQILGSSEPYEYLISSIEDFYSQNELCEILKKNSFTEIEYRNLSGGIAAIHSGWKI